MRRLLAALAAQPAAILSWFVGISLFVAFFWTTLTHLVWTWSFDENYSHGFLVPAIAAYFAYEANRRSPIAVRGGVLLAIGLIVMAIMGRLLITIVPVGLIGDLSLIGGLAGLVGLMAGSEGLRRYRFAIGFLIFMVPLPIALYAAIASPLQLLASRLSTALLNGVGIPVLCQGNMMILPGDVHLFVAEACSGMRQLTGFLALTTAVAYLANRPGWWRATLIGSSILIALTANVLRVTLTAGLAYAIDPALASGQFHTIEGLLLMGVGLVMLACECAILNAIAPRQNGVPQPHCKRIAA